MGKYKRKNKIKKALLEFLGSCFIGLIFAIIIALFW